MLSLLVHTTGLPVDLVRIVFDYDDQQVEYFENACKTGDIAMLQDLETLRARLWTSPLCRPHLRGSFTLASRYGQLAVVERLTTRLSTDDIDNEKIHAFHAACANGELEIDI